MTCGGHIPGHHAGSCDLERGHGGHCEEFSLYGLCTIEEWRAYRNDPKWTCDFVRTKKDGPHLHGSDCNARILKPREHFAQLAKERPRRREAILATRNRKDRACC